MAFREGADQASAPLPEGGGAQRPMGENFEVDLATGSGSYRLPLVLPPGPRQLQPELALAYATGYGNGLAGLGWSLGLPAVTRTADGQPAFDDARDHFRYGGQRLVAVGGGRYRQEVEKEFYRVDRAGDGWEVRLKDGSLLRYGPDPESRVELPVAGPHPTAVWLLASRQDPLGHRIDYAYEQEGGHARPVEIRYGPYRVRFVYEPRPDPVRSTRLGVEQLLDVRLAEVRLGLDLDDGAGERPVKTYRLAYEQAPLSGTSRLVTVTLVAFDADDPAVEDALPPMRFEYTDLDLGAARLAPLTSRAGPLPPVGDPAVSPIDLDGLGLPGFIHLSASGGHYWPNEGDLRLGGARRLRHFPSPLADSPERLRIASLSGHGLLDLVVMAGRRGGYYPLEPGGRWGTFQPFRSPPALPLLDERTRFVDLDFDGSADLLYADDRAFYAVLNRGGGDFEAPRVIRRIHDRDRFPDVDLADPAVRLAPMAGDGTAAIVEVHNRSVVYWPNLGLGRFAPAVTMADPPELPPRWDPSRLFLSDLDGDGLADLVYVDVGEVTCWFNRGGRAWSAPQTIARTPVATGASVQLVDLLGKGQNGLLWAGAQPLGARNGHYFLELSPGNKSSLLRRVVTPTGAEVRIRYDTAVAEALDDRGTEDAGYVPFPVQVVRSLETLDRNTGARQTTEYSYHRGWYDRRQRRFLGFGRVEQRDLGDAETPDRITVSHFHTRPPDRATVEALARHRALSRLPFRTEAFGSDDPERPFWVQEIVGEAVRVATGDDGTEIYFAARRRLERVTTDRGARTLTRRVDYEHDAFGNVTLETETQRFRDAADDERELTRRLATRYLPETAAYLVGLPIETVERDGDGALLAATRLYYDGAAFRGRPLGLATRGVLTRREVLAFTDALVGELYGADPPDLAALGYRHTDDPELGSGWWLDEVSQRADADGNPVVRHDPLGRDSRFTFDRFGIYPTRLVNALDQEVAEEYDYRHGQRVRQVGRDGMESLWRFDSHGRLRELVGPQDPPDQPSILYERAPHESPPRTTVRQRAEFGVDRFEVRHLYHDARGEMLQMRIELGGGRVAVNASPRAWTRFQPSETLAAYEAADTAYREDDAPADTRLSTTRRDALDRPLLLVDPGGEMGRREYEAGVVHHFDAEDLDPASPHFDTPRSEYFDPGGKLVSVVERAGGGEPPRVTRMFRNAVGLLERVVDHLGEETLLQRYDLLGRLVVREEPDAGRQVITYDAAGNKVGERRGDRRLLRRYDALNRVTDLRYGDPAAAPVESYAYDAGAGDNLVGRLARVEGAFGSVEYSYSLCGRLRAKRRTFPDRPGEEHELRYTYDPLGRVRSVTYPDGRVVDLGYDAAGRPDRVAGVIDAVDFDAAGYVTRVAFANGVETTYDYDDHPGRLAAMRTGAPGGDSFLELAYDYDRVGNPLRVEDRATVAGHVRDHRSYRYDALYRLAEAEGRDAAGVYHHEYRFDERDNLLNRPEVDGGLTLSYTGNRVTGSSAGDAFAYDDLGNLETLDGWTHTYDDRGRLIESVAADGTRVGTVYDHGGVRVTTRVEHPDGTSETTHYCDDAFVLAADGSTETYVFYNRNRVALLRSAADDLVVHLDPLGNPTCFSDLATGAFAGQIAYYPYGGIAVAMQFGSASRYLFGGHPSIPGTGLSDFGMRAYSAKLGRFVQPDPAVVHRPEDVLRLPRGLHPYAYVIGNPTALTDPHGAFLDDLFGAIGDAFSAVGEAIADAASAIGNAIADAVVAIGSAIGAVATAIWDGIKAVGSFLWEGVKWAANAAWEGIKWLGRALAFVITWTLTIVDFAITWLNPLNWIAIGLDQIDHPVTNVLTFAIKFLRSPLTTTVGLVVGLIGLATGDVENVAFKKGTIVFEWDPGASGFSGTVFGGTVHLWRGESTDDAFDHEIYHSYQYVGYGDAFIPTYAVAGGMGLLTSAMAGNPQWGCFGGVSDNYTYGQPLEMGGELIDPSDNCR